MRHTTKTTNSVYVILKQHSTNYSIRTNLHHLAVEKQSKLASNPFDDSRMYLNSIKTLSWYKHTLQGNCGCLKFLILYQKEICDGKTDEEVYFFCMDFKTNLNSPTTCYVDK